MVIINAKLYPIDRDPIPCGFVRVEGERIAEVGEMSAYRPGDGDVIDAAGACLLPGFVDAHTHIGIWEENLGLEGDDTNESSDPATPHLRAIDAINTRDPAFRTALEGGVTTVVVGPGSGNPIGGQCAAIKTGGSLWIDDRIVAAPLAMKMALGENPKREYGDQDETPMTRMATAAIIRENLQKAVEYRDKLARAEDEDDEPDYDAKLDALLPLLAGEIPAHIHAHRADDIATAVRIAEEFGLRYAIVHATEADLVAEPLSRLGDRFLGLITGPLFSTRTKPELSHLSFSAPGILRRHGLETALCTDHQVVPENYLLLCAALAVKHGMTEADALSAVTLSAAKLSGIESRVGSLTPGKDADLVLLDGHPFDLFTNVTRVFINGACVYGKE
ncbi:MAG: amidohydrolase [Ruminococcaceae bacterium]|nr:amidohydrolase [Oscillospiraceae bacterium]